MFISSTVFRFFVSNYYAEKTDQFNDFNEEIISIKNEISGINAHFYEQVSIKNIEQEALKLGFVPMGDEVRHLDSPSLAGAF